MAVSKTKKIVTQRKLQPKPKIKHVAFTTKAGKVIKFQNKGVKAAARKAEKLQLKAAKEQRKSITRTAQNVIESEPEPEFEAE
jgi:hypothetical protein